MKKMIILHLAIAATILLAVAQPAFAANGKAPDGGCQVGAHNEIVGEWQLFSRDEFAQYLVDNFNWPPTAAVEKSISVYAFCDHNNDGYACVMEQHLPYLGRTINIWSAQDNHPFGGK
jgi:hypothetical protein